MPERGSYRQTVPIEGEDDEDVRPINPFDLPPTYEEASTTSPRPGGGIGAGAAPKSQTRKSGPGGHGGVNIDIDDNGNQVDAGLRSGYRSGRAPERNRESGSDTRSSVNTRGYTSMEPMMWDERTRNGHWDKYEDPGVCFSDRAGCFFSDRAGCCFSDRGGCACSDRDGCCFSDRGGCFFSDTGGCCFSSGGACCCSRPPDFVRKKNLLRV